MHKPVTIRERVNPKNACHSERSGVSAANGTKSRNPAEQRLAWIAGFLDSATPSTLQQSAGLRSARNDTRFFPGVSPEKCMTGSGACAHHYSRARAGALLPCET